MKKEMNMMTKTNGKYTYKDLLLRKRILKKEIQDMEKMVSLEHLPQALGFISGNMRNKALDAFKNSNILSILIDLGIGFGAGKLISKFVNKKSVSGKLILTASSYLMPLLMNKGKDILTKINRTDKKLEYGDYEKGKDN